MDHQKGRSMAKPKRGKLNPLENISEEGFIGYVPEEEQPASTLQVQEFPIERLLDSPFQTREHVSPDAFRRLVYSIKTLGFQGFIPVRRHPEQENAVQIVAGGHTRREAAKEAGLTTLPVVIVQFTDEQAAYGTVFENEARTGLDPVERGKLYLLLREKLGGISQEALAQKIETTRDIIKECEAAARSADDIQAMLRLLHKDGKGTERSGVRAAKALRRLDAIDDPEQGGSAGRAAQERAPIIEAFLKGELTTNGLEKTVDAVLQRLSQRQEEEVPQPLPSGVQDAPLYPIQERQEEHQGDMALTPLVTTGTGREQRAQPVTSPSTAQVHSQESRVTVSPMPVPSVPIAQTLAHGMIKRVEQVEDASKRFQRYKRSLGDEPPLEEEKAILQAMLNDIQQLLERV